MRHETCLYCLAPGAGDRNVQALILVSESLGPLTHHHHTVTCDACGAWWFDDMVLGGLGIPVAKRRDTELCQCPNGLPSFTVAAVMVPEPEERCSCTKAKCEKYTLPVRLGNGRVR